MKIDWDNDTGVWNIKDIETGTVRHRVDGVRLNVPSELVTTDGGRHGYLITAGVVSIDEHNIATISKG